MFEYRGINWADIDVMSDKGVNWSDIDVLSDRGSIGRILNDLE